MSTISDEIDQIRIISYNCLGLKYLVKDRRERLAEIGRRLATADPPWDLIGLQECWVLEDFDSIREQVRPRLPYAKFYFAGAFGSGLAIFSRWPITESSMYRYSLNGRPTAFFRGDWYVGKGVACATIRFGSSPGDIIEIFCTHLHAPYESEPHDSYLCHRTAQAWEIAKLMRAAADRGHLVVGLGDFNMLPSSLAHRLIEGRAPVRDAWKVLHPNSSLGPADAPAEKARQVKIPSALVNLQENGAASDGVLNTWRWSKKQQRLLRRGQDIDIDPDTPDPHAKRLDYVFVNRNSSWQPAGMNVGMVERHPRLRCSLSDHFSVEMTLKKAPMDLCSPSPPSLLPVYKEILAMTEAYMKREERQKRLREGHFHLSVVISIACFVASFWAIRPFIAFLLVLVSTLNFGAGVVNGLIGLLFMGSELRCLQEFRWEIRNAHQKTEQGLDTG